MKSSSHFESRFISIYLPGNKKIKKTDSFKNITVLEQKEKNCVRYDSWTYFVHTYRIKKQK